MARPRDIRTLNRILDVRLVQRMAAEMEVARADAALRDLEARRCESLGVLQEEQESWSGSVAGSPINLDMAACWSSAILEREAGLRSLDTQVAGAEDDKRRMNGAWRDSMAREDVAESLARSARRSARRRREESALGDLADRTARRGST